MAALAVMAGQAEAETLTRAVPERAACGTSYTDSVSAKFKAEGLDCEIP